MNILPGDDITTDILFPKQLSGSFGDIEFECSSKVVRTFDDYRRKTAARFAEHKLIGRKPLLEFLGEDLNEISFKIKLVRSLGVDPKEEADKLRELCLTGSAEFLTIGEDVIGQFVLESIDEDVEYWERGEILISELKVRLKEYVDDDLSTESNSAADSVASYALFWR